MAGIGVTLLQKTNDSSRVNLNRILNLKTRTTYEPGVVVLTPINNTSIWRRASHLINAFIKKDANKYFTESHPNFIQNTAAVDVASLCEKLVIMVHDLPQDIADPAIICQIDFANAFQTPHRQLSKNDCILCKASRMKGV
jgi:hypothetical protein